MAPRKALHGPAVPVANRSHQSFLVGFAIEALKQLGPIIISEVVGNLFDHEKADVPSGIQLKTYRDQLALPPESQPPIQGAVVANDN